MTSNNNCNIYYLLMRCMSNPERELLGYGYNTVIIILEVCLLK